MIKGITFDLDGVYFVNGKQNFIKNLVSLGVSEAEARRVFLDSDEMHKKYKTGEWTDEQFWSWALAEWNLEKSIPEITKLLIDGYEVNNQVVEIVKKVRANGYKALICSNNFPARIDGLQRRFGFLDNFDVIVLSYEIGAIKPGNKIYEELIKKSGLRPDEIFYTDDSQTALDEAKKFGIQASYYSTFADLIEKLKALNVLV